MSVMRTISRIRVHVHLAAVLVFVGPVGVSAAPADVAVVEAVKSGDVEQLRALLADGADPNASLADGTTALHWAAYRDDHAAVDLLLREGAAADATSQYGVTPLALAATSGYAVVVGSLLDAGANPNTASSGSETVLMSAARSGSIDAVKMLLARGAEVDARENTRGQTALMWAAGEGHADVVRVLLNAGADLQMRSHVPADAEASNGNGTYRRRVARLDAFTPLLFAVRSGRTDVVMALLDAGAEPNETAPDGTSALVLAAANAHWELGARLLEAGADPDAAEQGWTALHQTVRTRNLNIGFFPHPEPTGKLSSFEFARALIEHGADVDARITESIIDGFRGFWTQSGATPMLQAAKGADAEMMRLLAAHGADASLSNDRGTTPLMAAAGVEMFNPNEDSGTNKEGLIAVEVALELGGDVNAANHDGDRPIHGAAFRGANEIVLRLVEEGAELHVENNRGYTPLEIANGEEIGRVANINVRPWTVQLLQDLLKERGLPWEVGLRDEDRYAFEKTEAVTRTRPSGGIASGLDISEVQPFLGTWTLAIESSKVPLSYNIEIKDVDGKVGTTIHSESLGTSAVSEITKDGESLSLKWEANLQGQVTRLSMTLTPLGEDLKAHVRVGRLAGVEGVATKSPPPR